MSQPLSTKIALVTGGSRGIGAAIVRRLAADGAAVAFTYSNSEHKAKAIVAELEAAGGRALAIRADSADAKAVQDAVALTAGHFGGLDILVSNAGILILNPLDDYSLEDFDRMFAVNVRAAFVGIQAAARHMKEGGRVITIGSVTADRSGFPTSSVYSMTKGAIASMTSGLARDLGPRGITVNNIQPGPTATDMNPNEDDHERLKPLMALGRLGEDREIAGLAAYLASAEAAFVTGASLTIDGGYLA
ncbi:3-oxoacyl-ACP reductase family protein [Rhizobium leguminosarum]|uniref:3-ketoacyl-ACP reductase n=2 Tax=Rhizobium leguminosarum TaxID=384 RepID=A0A1B8R1F2_RHILT|nr:3-oxoacyl-ACP reductase family protein [Rhizobium leguminosarum]MDH6661016.1 3-oxoacyl-[acyl-carrier protein] reductase [Rhizobium sophorae]AOO94616.1 3-ketoacyl-ACP reductase [Rhizobium leguminosarum bv. trifolii]ASS55802.1 3-oxoacyl-ACP reductase FabG [Rhizobium leguminosarum bv. viciae]MBA8836082.1 3-oxoacyl-[acyl-carrier protein] reductase [Rhizobium leguminosarum]MBB4329827.1 3-oxoacyl-[acyl-carrier protein] reductase [Rhizobium leguminosarum]